jgi:small conductance mechanosensitive channel
MDRLYQELYGPARELGGRAAGAALILIVGWAAVRFLTGPVRALLTRSRFDASIVSFLTSSLRGLLLAGVLLAALQQLGVETTSLLTLLGAAGLAVALSLQSSLANFAAGLLVLAFRTVRVGDLIEVGDVRGQVSEMLPFHIVVDTFDHQRVTVPNTLLTTAPVRNNTALSTRRVQWLVPVGPAVELAAARAALCAQLLADPRVLREPAPKAYVQDWALDRRVLAVLAWASTSDYLALQLESLEGLGQAVEALRAAAAPPGPRQ